MAKPTSKKIKSAPPKSLKTSAKANDVPVRTTELAENGQYLNTNQGLGVTDDHNSLKASLRGPTLLEDFVLRDKITHFDHERIPERVVHARGAGAFGTFECTTDLSKYTSADFLTNVGKKTEVFTRFSTVAGSRGSADTARDVRGFATRFYTEQGNYDLVGNNIPVFFIQDAIKFPDLIHAAKPEPHREIPQASTAHDTFWDFISLMPESLHMVFWIMSDRAIPRSLRMMEGFGVHTFKLVNAKGKMTFVKFHWKPRLGIHALTWDEAQILAGMDPDFHRRDLWDNIDAGNYPIWDLGVQLIPEEDEMKYPFDLLDPTKLVPEELVPVKIIGNMTLDRNPDNYFAQTEQIAFHPGSLVPGIDVSNDPLLQGRLFSYLDTQLLRLGGPNFHEIPINRPITESTNNQRDGLNRQSVQKGRVAYEPNSIGGGCPFHSPEKMKGFVHQTEKVDGHKIRARSPSFSDYTSQAQLFFNSQNKVEQQHIQDSLSFELSKVEIPAIRLRMINLLAMVDADLANNVANAVGVTVPKNPTLPPNPGDPDNNSVPPNRSTPVALADGEGLEINSSVKLPKNSPALSMMQRQPPSLETKKIALIVPSDANQAQVKSVADQLKAQGTTTEFLKLDLSKNGKPEPTPQDMERALRSTPSVIYDAVVIFDGAEIDKMVAMEAPVRFVAQALLHCKTVLAFGKGEELLREAFESVAKKGTRLDLGKIPGVALAESKNAKQGTGAFIELLKKHRHFDRTAMLKKV